MDIKADNGYFFGQGAFTTVKVVDGVPELLERHLKRLNGSLEFFGIERRITEEEVLEALEAHPGENFALKICVSPENLLFIPREDPYMDWPEGKLMRCCVSDVLRNPSSPLVYHKSLCYWENILEKRKARARGFDEALFFNGRGELCEGCVTNVYAEKNGQLYTPPLSCGLLDGTLRQELLESGKAEERILLKEELPSYERFWISNALMGLREISLSL